MSAKPYFDEEVEAARAHLATVSQLDAKSGDTIAVCRDIERRWLATVDALKARLAAAERVIEEARFVVKERGDDYSCQVATTDADGMNALEVHLSEYDALLASRPEGAGGAVRSQKDFERWAAACVNGPEAVRAIEGAYGQGWVDHANAHPTPRAEAASAEAVVAPHGKYAKKLMTLVRELSPMSAEAVAREARKAARAEALEEAALWHEDEARRISGEIAASLQIMRENASAFVGLNTSMDHEYAQAETHREAAASIRALKDKEPA